MYKDMQHESDYHAFVQFIFFMQWAKLKKYANDSGIKIVGDLPIYVSLRQRGRLESPRPLLSG